MQAYYRFQNKNPMDFSLSDPKRKAVEDRVG